MSTAGGEGLPPCRGLADNPVMGLTTENAHLYISPDPALGLDDAAGAVRALMAGLPYEEAPGAADRVFTLAAHPPWISIYDTETGSVEALARTLSKSLAAYVVAVAVEDSSRYSARLCRAGKWVDKISASALRKGGAGKPGLWAEVLAPGGLEQAEAARTGGVFAEQALRRLCNALRLPSAAALATPEDMAANPPEGALVLRYRSLHAHSPAGPPRLTLVGSGAAPAEVGQPFRQLGFVVANEGSPARGLRVRIGGEAIARGLIQPLELRVAATVSVGGGQMTQCDSHPLTRDAEGYYADLPQLELKTRVDPRSLPPGAAMLRALREYGQRAFHFHLAARALAEGSGGCVFRLEWLDGSGPPLEAALPVTVTAPA